MEEDAWSRQVDVPGGFNLHICNQQPSITQVLRAVKRQEHGLFNCIASVVYDYQFISQVSESFPGFPLLANLRCGAWYIPRPAATCYYKSTDGHSGEWSFSTVRLNLHVALLACKHGGVCIVDATRRGKTFPDALTKTIPIWAAVLNRAISRIKNSTQSNKMPWDDDDDDLYLPPWISGNERNQILSRLDTWVDELISVGADLTDLARQLRKPLRCLWVSQNDDAFLEEWKELATGVENLPYTPIILISASIPDSRSRKRLILDAEDIFTLGLKSSSNNNSSGGGKSGKGEGRAAAGGGDGDRMRNNILDIMFDYIPGAGDDEESWAKGLTPGLMWDNWRTLLEAGPEGIAAVAKRLVKQNKKQGRSGGSGETGIGQESTPGVVQWIGSTGLGLCTLPLSQENLSYAVLNVSSTDILEIPQEHRVQVMERVLSAGGMPGAVPILTTNSINTTTATLQQYCWLPGAAGRGEKHALLRHIPAAVTFISGHLAAGKKVIVVGGGGDLDVAACIMLACLIACFSLSEGGDNSQKSSKEICSTGLTWRRPFKIDPETLVVFPCCIGGDEGNEGAGDAAEGRFSRLTVRRYAAASIAVWAPQVVLSKTLLKQVFNAFLPERMAVPVASG